LQNVSQQLVDTLRHSVDVWSKVRLICEWNQNRHADEVTASNWGVAEKYYPDIFPIESIIDTHRPKRGILVGWAPPVGTSPESFTTDGYEDRRGDMRFFTASEDAKYKYWVSPEQSSTVTPYYITGCEPAVVYGGPVYTNKIRIGFETSVAYPTSYTVYITTDGTTWNSIGSNFPISSDGTVDLYLQDESTWNVTENIDVVTQLRGVRVSVTQMSAGSVSLSLIELGLRLELDFSDRVVSYNLSQELSDTSFVAPLGRASSNTATVVLDNTDGSISNDNTNSMLFGLIDRGVEFRLDLGINIGTRELPEYEWTRQLTMTSETWEGQDREGATATLKDGSEYLQKVKPNPLMYTKNTLGELIWSLLDSVGFSSWQYSVDANMVSTVVPVWWTDGEKSVWESLQDLAEVMQAGIYFDEYNILQIKPRDQVFSPSDTPVWDMHSENQGLINPDIEKLSKDLDFEANTVNVTYVPSAISDPTNSGLIPMEVVWEPEGDIVTLRSSNLTRAMNDSQLWFMISPADAPVWPYSGVVQIEGEFIEFDAKEYYYYTGDGNYTKKSITSEEERISIDNMTSDYRKINNKFTGAFRIKNRGHWYSEPRSHLVSPSSTYLARRSVYGSATTWTGGMINDANESALRLKTNDTYGGGHFYVCTRGSGTNRIYQRYGTRLKFSGSQIDGQAGIAWSVGTNDAGYYAELVLTEKIDANRRQYMNEVNFYTRMSNHSAKRLGGIDGTKGVPLNVVRDVWYDLEVEHTISGSTETVKIYVNGIMQFTRSFSSSDGPADAIGPRHGPFVRGNNNVLFEYLYGSKNTEVEVFDETSIWNRIYGGYQASVPRLRPYKLLTGLAYRPWEVSNKIENFWIDEYSPIVHEVREFDVKFEKFPVIHSMPYFSNESQVACPTYVADSFGAKFLLANISRDNAILKGEDTLMFGSDNPVDQRFFIYGRAFIEEDQRVHTVKDDVSIRKRGEIATDINSEWIRSQEEAERIGQWIVENWSEGVTQVIVESFGNPLLQIGDLVSVTYPDLGINGVHYYIISKEDSYSQGLETSFTLRKKTV
jgi:hypothetical protein